MTLTRENHNGVCILRLQGDLTHDSDLVPAVTSLLDQDHKRIVLELSGVGTINSGALGDLVRLTAQANTQGGSLLLVGPSPFVRGVFEITQLDRFFRIHPTLEAAIGACC